MTVNDLARFLKPVATTAGVASSWLSTAAAADYVTGHIDRFKLGKRYRGAGLIANLALSLGIGARLNVTMGLQDAAGSTGPWADVPNGIYNSSAGRRTQVVGPATTSQASPTTFAVIESLNLQAARRYIRGVMSFDLASGVSSSGQAVVTSDPVFVLYGGEEIPVESGLVPTSST